MSKTKHIDISLNMQTFYNAKTDLCLHVLGERQRLLQMYIGMIFKNNFLPLLDSSTKSYFCFISL